MGFFEILIFLISVVALILVVLYFISYKVQSISLKGKHVIVTGGSSGIGFVVADELVKRGCSVSIFARDESKLVRAIEDLEKHRIDKDQKIIKISVNVGDFHSVERAVKQAAEINNNHIDILICSAGVTKPEIFTETDIGNISWLSEINYLGSVYCTRAVLPYMKLKKSGRIVFVSSILGLMGFPGYAGYCASKFALKGFAESLDVECAPWNIYFSISCPGNVDTPMFEEEQKIKPVPTKKLEEGKLPIAPIIVANAIINSFHSWRFLIHSDADSFFISSLSAGFGPASFTELVSQFFLSPILRIVSMFERKKYRDVFITHSASKPKND
jgi:3-dehydrosphinganine reductase